MTAALREITESEGTPPRALALAGALALPDQPGVPGSVRELLRVGSVPRYRPERWNSDFDTVLSNNCYNYACDIRNNTYAQPGAGAGLVEPPIECAGKTAGAIADGLLSTGPVEDAAGVEFGHRVALAIDPGPPGKPDYHWYRHDRDGMWSQKIGWYPAVNTDDSGQLISDPRTADRGRYVIFCGFFTVPRRAVTLAGRESFAKPQAALARRPDRTVIRLGVFSGLPDPEWVLEPDEAAAVHAKLSAAARRPRLVSRTPPPVRTGYRGFLIDRPGATPGTRDYTVVHAGAVSDVRLTSLRADGDRLEQDLLEQARQRGFGDLL